MAREVEFGDGGAGKIRSFPVGLGLAIITLGIYRLFWYYNVNDELKDIGIARGDQKLATSSPAMSVFACFFGISELISTYNYAQRIKRTQRILSIPAHDQINPMLAFWTAFFGFLVIPALYYFWYVTKHQNRCVLAAGGLDYLDRPSAPDLAPTANSGNSPG